MNPIDFCNWLKGFFEAIQPTTLSPRQVLIIEEHIKLALESKIKFGLDPKKVRPANC